MPQDTIKAVQSLLKVFDTSKIVSPEDIQTVLAGIVTLLASNKKGTEALNAKTKAAADAALSWVVDEITKLRQDTANSQSQLAADIQTKLQKAVNDARSFITEARSAMPKDGKNAEPADVVPLVMAQIQLPENKQYILTGEDILNALDALPEDRGIDAKRIKNLPESRQYLPGGSTSRVVTVKHAGTTISKLFRSVNFAGSGVSATSDQNGNITVTITGSSGSESNGEVLTDSGNHTTFTFAHAPAAVRNVWIKETGQMLTPTTDYTFSSSTLTATSAQVDGNGKPYTLIASYSY